jgi:hypothetical protein
MKPGLPVINRAAGHPNEITNRMPTMNTTIRLIATSLAVCLPTPGRAGETTWQSASGFYPNQPVPAWERVQSGAQPAAAWTEGALEIGGASGTGALFFQQKFTTLELPAQLVIEIRLRYISACSAMWAGGGLPSIASLRKPSALAWIPPFPPHLSNMCWP